MAVTTTKAIIVQIPSNSTDPSKAWLETTVTPFDTTEQRTAAVALAKVEARLNAGRVLIRVTKVDDGGSTDPLLWTITNEDKPAVMPSVKPVSLSETLSVWARVRAVVMGQPWAEGLIGQIDGKLGTD